MQRAGRGEVVGAQSAQASAPAHPAVWPSPLLLQAVKPKFAVFVPHTAGRYQKKRFRKAQCPIVERWGRMHDACKRACHHPGQQQQQQQ